MKKLLLFSLLTFVAGVAIGLYFLDSDNASTSAYKQPVRDFTLTAYDGAVHLHDFEGKLVLLFFGYTSCPDVCPLTLQKLAALLKTLNDEQRKQVQVLFVSVDSQRDTAEKIYEYTQYFDKDIIGLTGSKQQIAQVTKLYAADYKKVVDADGKSSNPDLSYTIDHTASVYVINQDNIWVGLLPSSGSVDQWSDTIQQLL